MSGAKSLFMRAAKLGFTVLEKLGIDLREKAYQRYIKRKIDQAYNPRSTSGAYGITLAAEFDKIYSIAQVGRDFLTAMSRTSIPFSAFNLDLSLSSLGRIPEAERDFFLSRCKPQADYRRFLFFVNQERYKDHRLSNAITPFWEFEDGMEGYLPVLANGASRILAFSEFNYRYFQRIAPPGVPVHKVRYPFAFPEKPSIPAGDTRASLGIRERDFVVFFHFSYLSCYERKNPEDVVRAFCRAGLDRQPNAKLVIKTSAGEFCPDKVALFQRCIEEHRLGNILVIDQYLSRQRILELIAAADVYLSLHRGEGFGIGMLEAMSVGTPVVAANFGGNTDFTTEETAFLVDCELVDVDHDRPLTGIYNHVRKWAQPNIETAANHLRALYDDPAPGRRKAETATAFITTYFAIENFENDVRRLIAEWPV